MSDISTIPAHFNVADYCLDARLREGRGERVALWLEDGPMTYAAVAGLTNRYGNSLARGGVRPEERVIIALTDGAVFVGAFFGTLKIGAVAVMVNPELEADALETLLDYSRATAVVYDPVASPAMREACARVPGIRCVIDDASTVERAASELDTFATHRDDVAIWLFSGGTTGRPKAVLQPHRSFANTTVRYGHGVLGLTEDDITISVPKLFFGYATGSNLLFPFSVGASTVLFGDKPTPERLFALIARHRATVLVNVPTVVNRMLQAAEAEPHELGSLRLVTSAGEALPEALHRRWDETFGVPLLDGLGTAEMWHIFISNRVGAVRPGTLGQVVPGFEVRVADEHGNALPDGEVGTMWVRGGSRALGYWQAAEQTEEAFYGPWYRSEDLIRRDADGYITYCGRQGDLFKVTGRWVAAKELEECLLEHAAVRECAVVGREDAETGLTKAHAFVVLKEGATGEAGAAAVLEEGLRSWVLERLEAYKVPRWVTLLDVLPRTHLGKVDRGKLRAL